MRVSDTYKKHILAMIIGPSIKIIEAFFDLLIPLFMKAIIDLQSYGSPESIPNQLTINIAKFIRGVGVWVNNNQPLNLISIETKISKSVSITLEVNKLCWIAM